MKITTVLSFVSAILQHGANANYTDSKAIEGAVHYCPQYGYRHNYYGMFIFEPTMARIDGFEAQAKCPYGIERIKMEPISASLANGRVMIKEEDTGMKRICRLKNVAGNQLMATWDQKMFGPFNCRGQGSVSLVQTFKGYFDKDMKITPHLFKQLLPDIQILKIFANTDYEAAETLIRAISDVLSSPELIALNDPTLTRLCLSILEDFTASVKTMEGYKVTVPSSHITVQTAHFPNDNTTKSFNYTSQMDGVKMRFPSEILNMGFEQNVTALKLRVIAYSENLFGHWKTPIEATTVPVQWPEPSLATLPVSSTSEHEDEIQTTTPSSGNASTTLPPTTTSTEVDILPPVGHWRVFSIDLVDAVIENLTAEFEYTFPIDKEALEGNVSWKCVFWNEEEQIWSAEGMTTVLDNDGTSVTCQSTHFTAFSVLIEPLPLPIPGSDYAPVQKSVHSNILSILSSIGSAVSVVGLAGVVLTYGLFRSLRRDRSNRILLNLSVSLMFMHLMSISSGEELWDGHCFIPAALLHYFLHSSLLWMLMEAHHMHQLLISVFVKPETRFMLKRIVIAWGVPLVIVGTCAAIRPEVYYTGRYEMCVIAAHLNLGLYYGAYLAPVVIILVINLGVFCRIFKVLYEQTSKQRKHGQGTDLGRNNVANAKKTKYVMLSPTQIKGSLTVMILVGVGWVVGLFAIGPFEVFFKYLFCIFNAGQGALIFLFRVILHPQACKEWRRALLGVNLDASETSTTSSTNINNTVAAKAKMSFSGPGYISTSASVENSLTPSNPDAKDLAQILASMMQNKGNDEKSTYVSNHL